MSAVIITPVTGQRIFIPAQWDTIQINAAGPLGRLGIVLPPHQLENAYFLLKTTQDITNFDVETGTALRLQGCPIQLHANDVLTFVYTGATQTWNVSLGGLVVGDLSSSTYYILGTNPLIVQVDPSGVVQSGDLAFMLRRGALVGLSLQQLRPPVASLLGGNGLGGYNAISLAVNLTLANGMLGVSVGTTAGTVAAGDALAAVQITANAAVSRSGDTLTGPLLLAADPNTALGAATRQYVDAAVSGVSSIASSALFTANSAVTTAAAAMPRTGGSFSGAVLLSGPPTLTLHPASKAYTDSADAQNASAAAAAQTAANAAQTAAGAALSRTANLSDLSSAAQARLNLGIGPAAILSVGSGFNTLCAGDDPRLAGSLQSSIFGTPNGVASLDQFGRLNQSQLPLSVVGALVYKGTWNAANNTPLLQTGIGSTGSLFVVAVAGTVSLDGVNQWNVGDWAVFDGQRWDKVNGLASEVVSVAGLTGAITVGQLTTAGLASVASPNFSGTPTAPTAVFGTNTGQIATTAFVLGQGFVRSGAAAISGGNIDGSVIGATQPAAATFTALSASGLVSFLGAGALTIPVGTTAQQPTGAVGMMRFNSTTGRFENYNGGGWVNHVRLSGDTMTGTLTLASLVATGGTLDGIVLGGTTPAAATVTSLTITGLKAASFVLAVPTSSAGSPVWRQLSAADIAGLGALATQSAAAVVVTGGTVDGVSLGTTTPGTGNFTTLAASQAVTLSSTSSLVVGPATGGNKGAGTINATAIYVNGAAVGVAGGYVLPAATITTIGGVIVPAAGSLAVDVSGNLSVVWTKPGALGSVTPNTGAFTTLAASTSLVVGTPTSGAMGAGTINATGVYVNGVSVTAGGSTNLASPGFIGGTTPSVAYFTYLTTGTNTQSGTNLILNSASGNSRNLLFQSAGVNRWVYGAEGSAETGSNVGSDFNLYAFSDAGAFSFLALQVSRATGLVTMAQGAAITGGSINNATVGSVSAATGRFTTLTLTSSQTASFVLAAPTTGGAPTFRQLTAADITGFGTMATQSAAAVSITGGTISSVSLTSLTSIAFGSSTGNKISLYGSTHGLGINTNEACVYSDTSSVFAYRQGGLTGTTVFQVSGSGINSTAIGATTASTGRFTTLAVTGSSSIPGYATVAFTQNVGVTLMLAGPVSAGTQTLTGNCPFPFVITSATYTQGSTAGAGISFSVNNSGSVIGGLQNINTTSVSSATATATSNNTVNAGSTLQVVINSVTGTPTDVWITLTGRRA